MNFISETNRKAHEEYVRLNKLRLAIFEKSYPEIAGKKCVEIFNCRMKKSEKLEAFEIAAEIKAHEIYFSSFAQSVNACVTIKEQYGSEAAFLYSLYEKCIGVDGFLFLYFNKRDEIDYYVGRDYKRILADCEPRLAVDLFEHAYFGDYGFNKEMYLKKALSNLDLSKLSKNIKKD